MRKLNDAVFYVEMSRPKRGYYTATYKLITREPNSLPEHEITRRFFQMLEETIRQNPPYYLWTHNRWKRTKEEFAKLYDIVPTALSIHGASGSPREREPSPTQ